MAQQATWTWISIGIGVVCVLWTAWMLVPKSTRIRLSPRRRWERRTIDRFGRCVVFSTDRHINCAELFQIQELHISLPDGVKIENIFDPDPELREQVKRENRAGY